MHAMGLRTNFNASNAIWNERGVKSWLTFRAMCPRGYERFALTESGLIEKDFTEFTDSRSIRIGNGFCCCSRCQRQENTEEKDASGRYNDRR